jgi:lysozyme family protein
MSFETAYKQTAKFEGGYANSPKDPGGETFRGISRKAHPDWAGWPIIDQIKKALDDKYGFLPWSRKSSWLKIDAAAKDYSELDRLVPEYYEKVFYGSVKRWGLAEVLTDKLFDLYVNLRPQSAALIFQRAINSLAPKLVREDGLVGPATKTAAKSLDPDALVRAIVKFQEDFYLRNTIPNWPEAKESFLARARWIPET